MIKHVTSKCTQIPPEIREKLVALQEDQQTKDSAANNSRSRYGSRKMFFRRVWSRLHGDGASDKADHAGGLPEAPVVLKSGKGEPGDAKPERKKEDTTDWEKVLDGSTLVTLDDQGLISPAQFAALAQMKKCQLTKTDQTGWYKDREIGRLYTIDRCQGGLCDELTLTNSIVFGVKQGLAVSAAVIAVERRALVAIL